MRQFVLLSFMLTGAIAVTPKFECEHVHYARLHEANVHIKCLVKADPAAVDFRVNWVEKKDNTSSSLSQGQNSGPFTLLVEDGENSNEHVMSLVIDRVYSSYFREYVFEAENELGRSKHRVILQNVLWDTDESTRVGASLFLTLVLFLVSLL